MTHIDLNNDYILSRHYIDTWLENYEEYRIFFRAKSDKAEFVLKYEKNEPGFFNFYTNFYVLAILHTLCIPLLMVVIPFLIIRCCYRSCKKEKGEDAKIIDINAK